MKSLTRSAASLLLLALCLPSLAGASSAPATHEFRLDNGLKLIVREDHRAPVVVSQLWYKVGSSYETPGKTGLSHALEHMMFKGSAKLGPGESSRVLRELGAEENAFTSDDYTAYYQVLASDRLSVACAPRTTPRPRPTSASRPWPSLPVATTPRPLAGWLTSNV